MVAITEKNYARKATAIYQRLLESLQTGDVLREEKTKRLFEIVSADHDGGEFVLSDGRKLTSEQLRGTFIANQTPRTVSFHPYWMFVDELGTKK